MINIIKIFLLAILTNINGTGWTKTSNINNFKQPKDREKIGIIYVVHGGFTEYSDKNLFDTTVQIFSYDQNHFIYKNVIWNPSNWKLIFGLEQTIKEKSKYFFEYNRIGGLDPFNKITKRQLNSLTKELRQWEESLKVTFITDWAAWISGDHIEHYPYPRYLYEDKTGHGHKLTFCGESLFSSSKLWKWPRCSPERYNVDGPAERLLKQGVSQIILIDMTTSGVRFSKTYDVMKMTKYVVDNWNRRNYTDIKVSWVNDPDQLMDRAYPTCPEGWTASLGNPIKYPSISLKETHNPITDDFELGQIFVKGITKKFNPSVDLTKTGVLLLNHAIQDGNEVFDPKINDTLILNNNIKKSLLINHPTLKKNNIIGAFMGRKEFNSLNGIKEYSRRMRGENLGNAWLYRSNKKLPSGEMGYLYWDALELLKNNGVEHIVVAFPQITTDSVLNLVEVPNQIAKEIGYKTWMYYNKLQWEIYPINGHPFADYWGIWGVEEHNETHFCYTMKGCYNGDKYPPKRSTSITKSLSVLDPSLIYDIPAFGHLGYNSSFGFPNDNYPVQDQYHGTWAMYEPPNNNPALFKFLALKIIKHYKSIENEVLL